MATSVTPVPAAPTPAAPASAPVPVPAAAPAPEPTKPRTVDEVMQKILTPNPEYQGDPPLLEAEPDASAAPEGAAAQPPVQATDLEEVPGDDAPSDAPATPDTPKEQPPQIAVPDGSTFRIKGPDGKYSQLPENIGHIELEMRTKDGETKTYVKSLPELVQMARRGIGSEQVIERTRAEAEQAIATAQEQMTLNQEFITLMREVFSDDTGEAFEKRRAEFLEMTSAEARAKRAEQQLQSIEQREQQTAHQRQLNAWYSANVQPAIDRAFKDAPDVLAEAKIGKLNLMTQHLTVNGVVPPNRLQEFAEIVNGPFMEWTQNEQKRMAELQSAVARKQQEAAEAQRRAQSAVNDAGRAMAPVGRAAPDVPSRPKPRNVNEAVDFIVRGGMAAR